MENEEPEQPQYVLESAEARAKLYPDTFEIPSLAKRSRLKQNMVAKLIFAEPRADANGRRRSERMWVQISSVTTLTCNGQTTVRYVGRVMNDSFLFEIPPTEAIVFGPEHVCEWDVSL